MYDGLQSHKLPGLHRQRACPKAVNFMFPWQAAFPPKAKNFSISFCVTFLTYFDLHSQSTFISIRLCTCAFWGIVGVWDLAFSLAWYSALFLDLAILIKDSDFNESKPRPSTLKERVKSNSQNIWWISFSFQSDKTAYAIQYPGSVNFIWKSSLSCKLTFAMIITYRMLISYVKPPWCPYKSPSHFRKMNMGQHRSLFISLWFILQYIHDSLHFNGKYIMLDWLMLVPDIPLLPWLQSETLMRICVTLPLM